MKRTVFGLAAAVASLAVLATLDRPIAGLPRTSAV